MPAEILVGVDVGTTSVKALAVTLAGDVVGRATRPTPWRHAGPLADADPDELAATAIAVCADAAASVGGPVAVRAVGVTGIAEAGILIDSRGRACAPTLAWFDPRGDAAAVRAVVDPRDYQRATGRRLNSKPSLMKVMWLRSNVPTARDAVRHLAVAEWVVRYLGGEEVSESSLASRTGMLDVSSRRPWPVAEELVGELLPRDQVWAGDPAGNARGDAVPDVLRGATLTVAGLDHQSAVLIAGATSDGALFDSMGTAEALIRTVPAPVSVDHIEWLTDQDIDVDWSVRPGHQILIAGRLTGLTLERIAAMLGADDRESRQRLGEAALAVERGADSPRLVDVGNDAVVLGGITDGITPAVTWRSVVEDLSEMSGVAINQMASVAGPHRTAVLAGGWSHNPMVADSKARQLGGYSAADIDEPGALGAAFLGGVAAGLLDRPGADGEPGWRSA
jgi:sugar (pentulose or hexulose) kinase